MAKKAKARRATKPLKAKDLAARQGAKVKGGVTGPCNRKAL
ncbi:MAG TPA: hypothetical protein VNF03_04810 [Patescibacteria group bacterium]|jgi:hypothetical protein|nr:hypothetical protein [Patescibacteria group bacterium]